MPTAPWTLWSHLSQHYSKSEEWSDTQVAVFDALYNTNIPVLGNPWKASADMYYGSRKAEEYRNRHGISGGGHDPRILAGMSGSPVSMFSGGMNFVSKNLDALYKDKKPRIHHRPMSYEMAMDLYLGGY